MGRLAGKMFCCAMMMLPAWRWMASTTRGWQCPVLSTPAVQPAAVAGGRGGGGVGGWQSMPCRVCLGWYRRARHEWLRSWRGLPAARTAAAAAATLAAAAHQCRKPCPGACGRRWSTHRSRWHGRPRRPAADDGRPGHTATVIAWRVHLGVCAATAGGAPRQQTAAAHSQSGAAPSTAAQNDRGCVSQQIWTPLGSGAPLFSRMAIRLPQRQRPGSSGVPG